MADFWDTILGAGDTAYNYLTNTGDDGFLDDVGSIFEDSQGNLSGTKIAAGIGGIGSLLGQSGLLGDNNILTGIFGGGSPQMTGYQGKIPSYTASRMQVPGSFDPNRRPGSSGQRYFTDIDYGGGDTSGAAAALQAANLANPARQTIPVATPTPQNMAAGGIAELKKGQYLSGATDGMADKIPARIEGEQEARLSDGEFVIPADVVSHLGNGNSDAGAKVLKDMMSRVRKERTGNEKQGKEINPKKFLPA